VDNEKLQNKLLQDEAFKSVLTSLIEVIITWNECERENLFDALNALIGGEK
jgi:hypothetical protein